MINFAIKKTIMEAEIVHYNIPLWAIIPFVLMLLSIAICPLIIPEWWEKIKQTVSIVTIRYTYSHMDDSKRTFS